MGLVAPAVWTARVRSDQRGVGGYRTRGGTPCQGYFRLSKNEALDFGELKPLVYSAMVTEDLERFMVVVEVRSAQTWARGPGGHAC